jgi:hypothetical protein
MREKETFRGPTVAGCCLIDGSTGVYAYIVHTDNASVVFNSERRLLNDLTQSRQLVFCNTW